MKTKSTILKTALICIITGVFSQASAQTDITAVADFGNANMSNLNQVICMGRSVDLSLPTPDAGTEYVWLTRHKSDDGVVALTGTNLPVNTGTLSDAASNLTAAGYYIYKLKATNTLTGCSEIFEQLVYVLPTPIVTITNTGDLAACTNASEDMVLTASNASGTGVTQTFAVNYQWFSKKSTDPEVSLGNTTNTYTVSTGTTVGSLDYYVKATYKIKDCGATESNKKTVTISAAPGRPTIGIASN